MSLNRFHVAAFIGWFVTLAAVIGTRLSLGVPTTLAESAIVLLVISALTMGLLAVFRQAPPS